MRVAFLQTADPFRYLGMLDLTSRTVVEHCRRKGFAYESYVGIKRGIWPWQATYNRIIQLRELIERGFTGWAVYMDADAYVVDLDFDLSGYLADKQDCSAVLMPSMSTDQPWDVNVGVCLFNCGHPVGRHIIGEWNRRFADLSDERLAGAEDWLESDNDQDMLQQMLIAKPDLLDTIFIQDTHLMNSSFASYIRQELRGYNTTFEDRSRAIAREVQNVLPGAFDDSIDGRLAEARRLTIESVVSAVYHQLLRRAPDPDGLESAARALASEGMDPGLRDLIGNVMNSDEYRRRLS